MNRLCVFRPLAVLLVAIISGCSGYPGYGGNTASAGIYATEESAVDIRAELDKACGKLLRSAGQARKRGDTFLVVSFANLDDLSRSSRLGRLMGQDCGTQAVAQGYQVTEVLLSDTLLIDPEQGELMLSRDLQHLAGDHQASMVLLGTYTLGQSTVYANARIVRSRDALVMSAVSFELPLTREVAQLAAGTRS